MKDAFGGILNLALVVVFLMIVSGVLGLTVSYTKAFNFKNYVISTIEKYEGNKGCFDSSINGDCLNAIRNKANRIGYARTFNNSCPSGYDDQPPVDNLFCYKEEYNGSNVYKYKVITRIDVNIPIIKNIFYLPFFQVSGDTRLIKKR